MKLFVSCTLLIGLFIFASNAPQVVSPMDIGKSSMTKAAIELIKSLDQDQKDQAILPFDDKERPFWHFTPSPHRGLTWENMKENQRKALTNLLETGLSNKGLSKAREIMALELVLRDIEGRGAGDRYRHPELYYFMLFGQPGNEPWGWRFEGHHLSLNYTSVSDQVSVTPSFMGSNPAEVPIGPHKGKRVLAQEEDVARELLESFKTDQLKQVVIAPDAPEEIITGMDSKAIIEKQEGLKHDQMTEQQQQLLKNLVHVYLGNMEDGIAKKQLKRIESEGWNNVYFAWAGKSERGIGNAHYYRVHGPSMLIEYDNIQNNANHIHAVWRDLTNDFGEDLLRQHYETKH